MFNPYQVYYPLNGYLPWALNYMPQSQYLNPPGSFYIANYAPNIPQPQQVINLDDEPQLNNNHQIRNTQVQDSKPQIFSKSSKRTKGGSATSVVKPGRWAPDEHQRFLEGWLLFILLAINIYGKDWTKVEAYVKTRNRSQIRSHAQKYFNSGKKSISHLIKNGSLSSSKKIPFMLESNKEKQQEPRLIKGTNTKSSFTFLEQYM